MNVMVVDDEKDIELLFRQHFRKEIREGRVEFLFASSGEDALARIEAMPHPPDLIWIFTDINMPGMSGLDLLRALKSQFPQIKVSMITAYGDQYYRDAVASGADRYYTKPLDFNALKQELFSF